MEKTFITKEFYLSQNDKSKDNIAAISDHNRDLYQNALKELNNYRKIVIPEEKDVECINDCQATLGSDSIEVENPNLDITFYINLLQSCPSFDELSSYLPKRKNLQFNKIMNLLILNILKEVKEYETFLIEEEMDESDMKEFKKEIHEKYQLIEALKAYRDKLPEEIKEEEENDNILIYLKTTSGNYTVLSDFKNIDYDYYESFLELLLSIKEGTFKNIGSFINHNKIINILEVKNFKTRIIFQRVEKNIYIIAGMFIKKVDNDTFYREYIINRSNLLQSCFSEVKENIENTKFLEENNQITLSLIQKFKKGRTSYE